jgi:hypothetical protein
MSSSSGGADNEDGVQLKQVMMLIKANADVNATDPNGKSAIHYAAEKHKHELLQLLIDNNASFDNVTARDERILMVLIKANADVNATDLSGKCAIHYAAERGEHELLQLLIDNKANLDTVTARGESVLDCALRNIEDNPAAVFAILSSNIHIVNVFQNAQQPLEGFPFEDDIVDADKVRRCKGEYIEVHTYIGEYHHTLRQCVTEDKRGGMLGYLGLSEAENQVKNTSIENCPDIALIPGHVLNAKLWYDKWVEYKAAIR